MRSVGLSPGLGGAGRADSPGELRDRGVFATRQLAKRQITWLTNSLPPKFSTASPPTFRPAHRLVSRDR